MGHIDAIQLLEMYCRLRDAERSVDVLCMSPKDWPLYLSYATGKIALTSTLMDDFSIAHKVSLISSSIFDPYSIPKISLIDLTCRKLRFFVKKNVCYSNKEVAYILSCHHRQIEFLNCKVYSKDSTMHLRYSLGICQYIIRRSICGEITKFMNLQIEQFMQPSHMQCYTVKEVLDLYRNQ